MYWQSKQFHRLADLPDNKLFVELENGLVLIHRNVTYLVAAASSLAEQGAGRAARILASHAADEAGKFLVLMDAARCPKGSLSKHLKRTGQHLARLLYAECVRLSPATFAELRRYLDDNRRSHYLDGNEGLEWVCRNTLLYWREQAMYVDYIEMEDKSFQWQDPADLERLDTSQLTWSPPLAADLVEDMVSAGFHRSAALAVIADHWRTFTPTDDTHIADVVATTKKTMNDLESRSLLQGDLDVWQRIVDRWTFPLWSTETREVEVHLPELLDGISNSLE